MKNEQITQNKQRENGEGVPIQAKLLLGIMVFAFIAIILKLSGVL